MVIKLVKRETEGELIIEGRLDSNSAPEAEEIFTQVGERFEKVVLNMEKLEYTSSAGLRIIKNLQVQMNKKQGELVLKNVNKMVMEVFEMTGFAGFLKFI